jgi:hypothetical protein|tara:strand:+ start:175 stop:540 length:366 start_codon:yes stop_codon:yes gene_type:complete
MEIEYKRKLGSTIPFGWELVENSKDLLRSIPEQHELLDMAKQHAKTSSLREVAKWLSAKSERSISHVALFKMLKKDESERNKKAANIRWERVKAKTRSETQEDLVREAQNYSIQKEATAQG